MRLAVVVLNYLNWKDTIECINSALLQKDIELDIIVVDNHSQNESVEKIKQTFDMKENVHVIETEKNYGFARGNNIGIKYAMDKCNAERVFVSNNDVLFPDIYYFSKLSKIEYSKDIGALGTQIIGSDGINQNPYYRDLRLTSMVKDILTIIKTSFIRKVKSYGVRSPFRKKNRSNSSKEAINKEIKNNGRKELLHGSAILLTEHFLSSIHGFYPETFLYFEENILGIMFEKLNLRTQYVDNLEMYHKEDQSSILSFSNSSAIKDKMRMKSIWIAIKVKISSMQRIAQKTNEYKYNYRVIK